MKLFSRREATLITNEKPLRMLMPYLMPTRNGAVVYFEQRVPVQPILAYIEEKPELSLFHVLLAAMVRILVMKPQINRFVMGGRLYQRHQAAISFVVKKRFEEQANMTAVKVEFEPDDTILKIAERVNAQINQGRSDKSTSSEKEMAVVSRLPGLLLRILFKLQSWLDAFNLLPYAMIKDDPMYASMFVANLGSINLKAPWHHLSEYGTTPIFGTIGKIEKVPFVTESEDLSVREELLIRWSVDERITDGFYFSKALELLESILQNPKEHFEIKHPF